MQNRFYDPAVGHIYIRGGGAPHTGVNLRDNRPCEANRERLSLSQHSPPQRSLAPIVNGLSTDVKLLFLPPDFLFIIRWQQRVVSASIQQWQEFGMGLREMPSNPIQSDSILSPIQKILTATAFVASFLNIGQDFVFLYTLFVIYIFLLDSGLLAGLNLQASTHPILLRCVSIILQ